MRIASLALALVLALLSAIPAEADSWMAPRPMLASSLDGRWYVIVEPAEGTHNAMFRLVARAKGKPARTPILQAERNAGSPKLEPGDRVVARGACTMPVEVRCLDAGKGFVLFENYGSIGFGTTLDVRDGKGRSVFTKTLKQLFPKLDMETFMRTVSSIWWYDAFWVDERAGDIVLLWKKRDNEHGVLRVALKDGAQRDGKPSDVLARIGHGTIDEQIKAIQVAGERKIDGLHDAVVAAFSHASVPVLVRLHAAFYLLGEGDKRGVDLFAASARSEDPAVRRYAVKYLPRAVGEQALPALREAMASDDRTLRDSAEYAFRHMGAKAVPTLIDMVSDERAAETYRAGAATALWNMPVEDALPAEDALAKAAQSTLKRLAYAAGHAVNRIREHKAKP